MELNSEVGRWVGELAGLDGIVWDGHLGSGDFQNGRGEALVYAEESFLCDDRSHSWTKMKREQSGTG